MSKTRTFGYILLVLAMFAAGAIAAERLYQKYPDVLFDGNFDDIDGLRAKLIDVAANNAGDRCARIAPSSFYNSLAFAKDVGYSSITYSTNVKSCEDYDEKYAGEYYIVYQNFSKAFCELK